ncbi:MAG: alpha/beta hydrolase [Alphaproteobacteria bacterium]
MAAPAIGAGVSLGRAVALLVLSLLAAGCFGGTARPKPGDAAARQRGWERVAIDTGPFLLVGYRSFGAPEDRELTVYIEGDGTAWLTPTQQSTDPTPRHAQAWALALLDPSPNRLYLARPCQYQSPERLARCDPAYWSVRRYSEEVIAAMSEAITVANDDLGARRIVLIGYSGGGTVAALIAARRPDVARLVTVAANLDHAEWTRRMNATPLDGSLNPVDQAGALARIPQVHFVGEDDRIVPKAIAESYRREFRDASRVRIVDVANADHDCCWTKLWPTLVADYLGPGS